MTNQVEYKQEEVSYVNKTDNVTLSGTLTFPEDQEKPFSAVILISGMGPIDRDYTMPGHKLFLVLADYLSRHGMAVLRFDKRGVGKSTGTFSSALTTQDFANDVLATVDYLKSRNDINIKQIGLIGHSEGGIIAPLVASKSNDVAFLVLMAGVSATDITNVINNVSMQLRADGATEELILQDIKIRKQLLEIVKSETDLNIAQKKLSSAFDVYWSELPENLKTESEKLFFAFTETKKYAVINMFNSLWYRFFLNYDPVNALKQISMPVLAITGDCDFITPSEITLPIISKALKEAGNKAYTILELPNLNHWLQSCQTGAMTEYGKSAETISPEVLQLITDWILER